MSCLKEDDGVLALAYLNSHFQTGLKNVLDRAVLDHPETHDARARSRTSPRSMRFRSTFSAAS